MTQFCVGQESLLGSARRTADAHFELNGAAFIPLQRPQSLHNYGKTPTLNAINRSCDAQTATALINLFLLQLHVRRKRYRLRYRFFRCFFFLFSRQINYHFNQTKSANRLAANCSQCFIAIIEHTVYTTMATMPAADRIHRGNANLDFYPSVVQCDRTYQTHLIYC